MIVSIHQPNFIPWGGYFEKIQQADLFIIMGNCQFEKNKYQNRFYANDRWHTMSVKAGNIPIIQKRYVNHIKDWKVITERYPKLINFNDLITWDLWKTNSSIIVRACNMLDIKTPIRYDYPTELKGTERLVDICVKHGATKYLSGISGKKYLDLKLFETYNIEVIFQDEKNMDKRPLVEII